MDLTVGNLWSVDTVQLISVCSWYVIDHAEVVMVSEVLTGE